MTSKNLVLRTVYIDPEVDDLLRNEAFAGRTSKNDLFRKYLRLGMQVARSAEQALSAPRETAKVGTARKRAVTVAAAAKQKATAKPSSATTVKVAAKRARASSTS